MNRHLPRIVPAIIASSCVALAPSTAQAQTTIQVADRSSEAGFTVSVPVSLDGNQEVVGLQFDLTYESPKLALGEPSLGPGLGNLVLASRKIAPGRRRFLVYTGDLALLPNSILINVPATVPPGVSEGPISITLAGARATDNAGNEVSPLSLISGVITVEEGMPIPANSIHVAPGGGPIFSLTGVAGKRVALQFSVDLESWVDIEVFEVAKGEVVEVDDPAAPRKKGFYRLRVLPE